MVKFCIESSLLLFKNVFENQLKCIILKCIKNYKKLFIHFSCLVLNFKLSNVLFVFVAI